MNLNVNLIEEIVIQVNGGIMTNVDVTAKNVMHVKKNYIWNPAACNCENGKDFNEKKATCKTKKKIIYVTCSFINYYIIIDKC